MEGMKEYFEKLVQANIANNTYLGIGDYEHAEILFVGKEGAHVYQEIKRTMMKFLLHENGLLFLTVMEERLPKIATGIDIHLVIHGVNIKNYMTLFILIFDIQQGQGLTSRSGYLPQR